MSSIKSSENAIRLRDSNNDCSDNFLIFLRQILLIFTIKKKKFDVRINQSYYESEISLIILLRYEENQSKHISKKYGLEMNF